MKHLIVIFFVTFQAIIFSAALAWSPLEGAEQVINKMQHCLFVTASDEENQEEKKQDEAEEEEPECD